MKRKVCIVTLNSGQKLESSDGTDNKITSHHKATFGEEENELHNINADHNYFLYMWWRDARFVYENRLGKTYFDGASIESIRILK